MNAPFACFVLGLVTGIVVAGLPLGRFLIVAMERADAAEDELRAVRVELASHGFEEPGTSPAILVERMFNDLDPAGRY